MKKSREDSRHAFEEKPPAVESLPPCARCLRENGVEVYGYRLPVQRSCVHPLYEWRETRISRGRTETVEVTRRGPSEPLCGWHVELAAWEVRNAVSSAPPPPWTIPNHVRGVVAQKSIVKILENLEARMTREREDALRQS